MEWSFSARRFAIRWKAFVREGFEELLGARFLFRWKEKLRKWREDRPTRGNLFQRDAFLRGKKTEVGGYKRPSFLSRASPESAPLSPLPCDGAMPERDGGGVLDSPAEKTVGNFLNHLRLSSRRREGPGWSS